MKSFNKKNTILVMTLSFLVGCDTIQSFDFCNDHADVSSEAVMSKGEDVNQSKVKTQTKPKALVKKIKATELKGIKFGRDHKHMGTFRQSGKKSWKELSADPKGNNFNFTETARDEWSVYLRDKSRGVNIQLDLHTRKVYYSDSQSPRRELYQILSATDKCNGWIATEVQFGDGKRRLGTFRQSGKKSWKELSADPKGNNFNFTEIARDEWSVYLRDKSRGVNIQLDLHTRKVYYSDSQSPRCELYLISSASDKQNGWIVDEVNFGRGNKSLGTFRQSGKKSWKELSADPSGNSFNFNELARDEWSVYLKDDSRGVRIQLDLHTKKVYYSDRKNPRRELYQILK